MEKSFEGITHVNLTAISIPADRQRTSLSDIDQLAVSIKTIGLLHPIIVRGGELPNTYILVAGERRLRAFELLSLQGAEAFKAIPVRVLEHLDPAEAKLVELEENVKRQDLAWKDFVAAMKKLMGAYAEVYKDWPMNKIAEHIGYSYSMVMNYLRVARALEDGNLQVASASGIRAALAVLDRERERRQTSDLDKLADELGPETTGLILEPEEKERQDAALEAQPELAKSPAAAKATAANAQASIIHGDFAEWVESYSGPRFNFIHCDFPYGINHQDSAQGGAQQYGAYDDTPDTYWMLLGTLLSNRDKLMLRSCHVMFWFSMKFYTETLAFVAKHAPDMVVQEFPLIWMKSDNKGIVPDIKRQPRRIYETALVMSRGDRQIIKPVANAYAAPTNKSDAIHISEKPIPVLKHFFSMFVDEQTRVLDPTCGGGTAIRAAEDMRAEFGLGIELDELYAIAAQKKLVQARGMKMISGGIDVIGEH